MTRTIHSPLPPIPDDPTPAEYHRLARELSGTEAGALQPLKVALLGSSTFDFLEPLMLVEGARIGYAIDLYVGAFGQLEQPLLDPESELYAKGQDILVLAFQPDEIAADVYRRFYASQGSDLRGVCDDLLTRLIESARAFRDHTGRPTLVANFTVPSELPLGLYDANAPGSLTHTLAALNAELASRLASEADIYVWDLAGLVRSVGTARWSDPRLKMLARVAVATERQPDLARHLLRAIVSIGSRPAKCLVLDLDNTLWGGVVGDDGMRGLQLGDDWPGRAFKDFQRAVLGLRDRGIVLAVVSKNDEETAKQVFDEHPEMLIRWDDLATVRINWHPKSANVRAIAEDLNIGVDSLVFFDDNVVERAEVRAHAPEVHVIDVPTDPAAYTQALAASGVFDQTGLSMEDLGRADMYQLERARKELRREAPTLDDFLMDLEMKAEVGEADEGSLPRIAQLVAKTNQFNLTTRRHPPAELSRMAESEDWVVAWLRLRDRFGDQGLVAVGIVEFEADTAIVDSFLMSCRVMNREVESAMMSFMVEKARHHGCRRIRGTYRPTNKNHIVSDLFLHLGFVHRDEQDGETLWELDLETTAVSWPDHIHRTVVIPSEAA